MHFFFLLPTQHLWVMYWTEAFGANVKNEVFGDLDRLRDWLKSRFLYNLFIIENTNA